MDIKNRKYIWIAVIAVVAIALAAMSSLAINEKGGSTASSGCCGMKAASQPASATSGSGCAMKSCEQCKGCVEGKVQSISRDGIVTVTVKAPAGTSVKAGDTVRVMMGECPKTKAAAAPKKAPGCSGCSQIPASAK